MDIHKRIRERREALDLSMEALADRLGVSWQTVQQWERNTAPKRTRLPAVAQALNTTPDWLLFGHGPAPDDGQPGQLELLPLAPPAYSPLAARVAELMDKHRGDEMARTELWAHAMRLFGGVGYQGGKEPPDRDTSAAPRPGPERQRARTRA